MSAWKAGDAAEQWRQEVAPLSGWFAEPMPNPREVYREALASRAAWLRKPDLDVIFAVLDDENLTICHKAPTDA